MKSNKNLHFSEPYLHAYLDGELNPSDTTTLEEHLKACSACRAELQSISKLFSRIESLPEIDIPRDISFTVMERIGTQPKASRRWNWLLAAQMVVSVLLLWISWPLAEPYIQTALEIDWESTLDEIGWVAAAHFDDFSESAVLSLEQAVSQMSTYLQTPELELVESLMLPLLISATLLWVVGNGLLLGERKFNR